MVRLRRALADEGGDGPTSAAILAPIILMLTMAIIQTGLYFHARTVAQNAAQIGMESARTLGSDAETGRAAAAAFITQVDSGSLSDLSIEVNGGDTITARVSAQGPALVPLLPMPRIDVVAVGPAERITQP